MSVLGRNAFKRRVRVVMGLDMFSVFGSSFASSLSWGWLVYTVPLSVNAAMQISLVPFLTV